MKSRTSSCKALALRKDITRFWPVWAAYILIHAFLQLILCSETREYWYLASMGNLTTLMAAVNCGYGLAAALMLFGDLFNPRMCSGIHSLPLKREDWFGIHLVSGILFALVPNTLAAVLMEALGVPGSIIQNGWQMPLYWWAAANLQYLFFFALGSFCVMCTGSFFAAAVVYGSLNWFSLLLWLLVDQFYTPLLHGVVTQSRIFKLLSPSWWLTANPMMDASRERTGNSYIDQFGVEQAEYIGSFSLRQENWIYLGILTAIGLGLLLAARQMYKKRQLEKAGDFMAVAWLEPVFQVVFTVLCAAATQGFFATFFGYRTEDRSYVTAGLGLAAGWFAGRMLLERSTRVFRLKNIAGLGLLTAVLAASLALTSLDPLGIEDWVPEPGEVTKAQMTLSHRTDVTTMDPEEIEDFLRLHELALAEKLVPHPDYADTLPSDGQEESVAFVNLTYWLENGWVSEREYYIRPFSEAGDIARNYASRLEEVVDRDDMILGLWDFEQAMRSVVHVTAGRTVPEEYITEAFLTELARAINADCEAGNMVQSAVFHPDWIIEGTTLDRQEPPTLEDTKAIYNGMHSIHLDLSGPDFFCYLNVYADCENTLAVLEPTGVLELLRQEMENEYYG